MSDTIVLPYYYNINYLSDIGRYYLKDNPALYIDLERLKEVVEIEKERFYYNDKPVFDGVLFIRSQGGE